MPPPGGCNQNVSINSRSVSDAGRAEEIGGSRGDGGGDGDGGGSSSRSWVGGFVG